MRKKPKHYRSCAGWTVTMPVQLRGRKFKMRPRSEVFFSPEGDAYILAYNGRRPDATIATKVGTAQLLRYPDTAHAVELLTRRSR